MEEGPAREKARERPGDGRAARRPRKADGARYHALVFDHGFRVTDLIS